MTDTQLLTIALAIIVPLTMLLYSNSRITDTKVSLDKRIDDLKDAVTKSIGETKETLRADIATLSAEMRTIEAEHRFETKLLQNELFARFDKLDAALKQHELEHHN